MEKELMPGAEKSNLPEYLAGELKRQGRKKHSIVRIGEEPNLEEIRKLWPEACLLKKIDRDGGIEEFVICKTPEDEKYMKELVGGDSFLLISTL